MKRFTLARALAVGAAVLLGSPSEANANGRFPESNQLIFSQEDPNLVLLRVTFGLLVSHDRGQTFDWVCEQSIGYSGVEDPMYATTPSGHIVCTTFQGMTHTEDQACTWKFVGDPKTDREVFVDLTQNPNDRKNIISFSSGYNTADDAGNSLFDSQLWETKDEGRTFVKLGPRLEQRMLGYTLDVTKSDPNRIYVSAVRDRAKTGAALLLTSTDHGQTWTEQQIPLEGSETSMWIAAVDPEDAEKVYLRTYNNPDAPGRLILREKDPSDPTKGVFRTLFTSKAPLDGFALSADNKKVWIGSPFDGVWMANVADYKFEQKSTTAVKCLASSTDGLWACSNEAAKPIGFVAGLSTDDGATFTAKAHFCDIRGPLNCSAESTTTQSCAPVWLQQKDILGCGGPSTNNPDGGFENDAGGFQNGNGNGADTTTTKSSCDCQTVLSDHGWSSIGGAAASIAAVTLTIARRRKRQRGGSGPGPR